MSSQEVRVTRHETGAAWIVSLPPQLLADVEGALLESCRPALASEAHSLVLDFSNLHYVNSAGIGTLVLLLQKSQARQMTVRMAGASRQVRVILERVGLTRFAPLHDSVEEALGA